MLKETHLYIVDKLFCASPLQFPLGFTKSKAM